GQVIVSAKMYLYCHTEDDTSDRTVSAYRVLLDWVEGTQNAVVETGSSCWNYARYTSLPWNTVGCSAASDVTGEDSTADRRATPEGGTTITGTNQYYSWDLTNAVRNWYNGEWSEYGVVLINDSEGIGNTRKYFRPTENGTSGVLPYLEVAYEPESNAVTEFVCTIKNSGGDYTTLGAWESNVQCDLTVPSTKVFNWDAKGSLGVPGDGVSVRKSTDPNVTATCVHVTGTDSGQILLKDISGGTFSDNDVVRSVSNANISVTVSDAGQSAIAVAECYDALTESVTLSGWSTNETNYAKIITNDDSQLNLTGDFTVNGSNMYVVLGTDMQATIVTVNNSATLKILGDKSLTATNNINIGSPGLSTDTARIIATGDPAIIKEDHSLPPAWYNASWKYCQKFSIDHTKIDEILTDFPVLVRLTTDVSDVFGEAQADGDDILFTTADGITKVDHELEKYLDAAGSEELIAHVEIPSVSADQDTVFYMYYGNSGASSQQSPAGTWNTNFEGVWHLSEDPSGLSPQMQDSTASANHGTSIGSMTHHDQVLGKVDGSLDFDGTDDYIDVPSLTWQPTAFSLEFWINPLTRIDYNQAVGAANGWDAFLFHTAADGALYVGTAVANRFAPSDLPANTLVLNEWQHFVYTFSGGVAKFYKNGQLLASKGQSAPTAWGGFRMGSASTSTLHGRLDEVRISDVARSDAWVKATYYSQTNALLVSPGTDNGATMNAVNVYINGVSGVGASVTATGQGFLPEQGPGAGEIGTSVYGGGAGYGGQGGDSDDGGEGGATYGSPANPDDLGSGAGTVGGGRGGAAIEINTSGFLSVNGSLVSNGNAAESGSNGGGGAGGAIKVTCGTLAGLGKIHANGGAGAGHGGGGGGGRIYLRYGTETFSGTISLAGGIKGGDNSLSSEDGDGADGTLYETDTVAETIYWDNENGNGLWSDAINWSSDKIPGPGDTVIFDGDYSTDDCIADGVEDNLDSIILEDDYGGQVTFNADFVNGGGELTLTGAEGLKVLSGTVLCKGDVSAIGSGTAEEPHGAGIAINAVNITVASGAEISANDQGFPDQQGPGAETPYAGAGHGGLGGNPWDSTKRGPTYGSLSDPTALGSGGGSSDGGPGGGAVKLVVADTLTVNGTISANGGNATATNHGGGAGGSMWISTDTFAGSGFVMADGGGGNNAGGGGGGGRISLQWTAGGGKRTFNGVISAKGGARGLYGGTQEDGKNGTIYVPSGLWNELWNATYPLNGDVALVPGTHDIAHLHITNNATLECQGDPDDGPDGSGVIINATDIIVDSGSGILVDGLGFLTDDGPGIADIYAGASHGGRGGNSWSTSSSA
ncbi:MAG: DUF2341 domain-containing protein, partial [Deltaproteobacteria bacterium]|nr:DUF2341 domain-containing protein [Deltaproteobacteria bacterium]